LRNAWFSPTTHMPSLSLPSFPQCFNIFFCILRHCRATATVPYWHYHSTRCKYFATPFQFRIIGTHSLFLSCLYLGNILSFTRATNFDYAFKSPPSYPSSLAVYICFTITFNPSQGTEDPTFCSFGHVQVFLYMHSSSQSCEKYSSFCRHIFHWCHVSNAFSFAIIFGYLV
jgi:hypothetical protein